jgi:hypothetical protein
MKNFAILAPFFLVPVMMWGQQGGYPAGYWSDQFPDAADRPAASAQTAAFSGQNGDIYQRCQEAYTGA